MEKLALTCKTLYDKDICDKANELRKHRTPKILFKNLNDWNNVVYAADTYLEQEIAKINCKDWQDMWRFHPSLPCEPYEFSDEMFDTIKKYLTMITENDEWSQENTITIMRGLSSMLRSVYHCLSYILLEQPGSMQCIPEMIFEYIRNICWCNNKYWGDNDVLDIGHLVKVPHYKCCYCNKIKCGYDWFFHYSVTEEWSEGEGDCNFPYCDKCYYNKKRWNCLVMKLESKYGLNI